MRGNLIGKRGLLAAVFVAALTFASVGAASDAEARGCRGYRGGGHHSYYGGGFYSPRYYGGPRAYSSYYGPRYYGPAYYNRGGAFYYGGRNVAIGVGW